MSKLYFLTAFLSFGVFASEFKCTKGTISQIADSKEVKETSHFCYNRDHTRLVSHGCQKFECVPNKSVGKFSDYYSEIGTPGFKICRKLGGEPEIIEFFVDGKSYSLDRCLFKEEYVNVGFLIKHLRDKNLLQ